MLRGKMFAQCSAMHKDLLDTINASKDIVEEEKPKWIG